MIWTHRTGSLDLTRRTAVMGILNITPDSFSDGGRYFRLESAVERALQIEKEGADILDIGAQSTRPGHIPIPAEEEWERLAPVLAALAGKIKIPISLDTYEDKVASWALEKGVSILNDVSGSRDNRLPELAAAYGAGLVMMHSGTGTDTAGEKDVVTRVREYFLWALERADRAGLPLANVCLDPGIGFGKDRKEDLELIARLPELLEGLPDCAVMMAASRKRVVAACCGESPVEERLSGTLALHSLAQWNGARVLRVHDIKEAVQAARVTDALLAQKSV